MARLSLRFVLKFAKLFVPAEPPTEPDPLNITTTVLAQGTVGFPYSRFLTATGGVPPYSWQLASGTLPSGITLGPGIGELSGTPTLQGTSNFTIRVVDDEGATDTQAYSLVVNPAPSGNYPYYDSLISLPEMAFAYAMRSQAQLDAIPTGGDGPFVIPTVYDPSLDAGLWQIDPSGVTPHSGKTDAEQKRPNIQTNATSLLLTWDTRWDNGWEWRNDTESIKQHKTYRTNTQTGLPYITIKTEYNRGKNTGLGILGAKVTAPPSWMAPGSFIAGGEIIQPYETADGYVYIQANVWSRWWMYWSGSIGGGQGGAVSNFSVWFADENRDPIQFYNQNPVYTPAGGISTMWFEYDASDEIATNQGLMKSWNRNFVVLHGLSYQDVLNLLQRP